MAMPEGYDVEIIQDISSDLYCVICLKLMRNPVQFKCGHGMCYACFKSLLHRSSQRSSTQCPQCREVVKEGQIVSNVMLHRLILSLNVRCPNHERGCKWTGDLDRFENHVGECTKNPENPSINKKNKRKKSKKEALADSHPNTQSVQNELLLQITEQLSKLNDCLPCVTMGDGNKGRAAIPKTQESGMDTWFSYFFAKSVTASCKTKFAALLLFSISLLSGMHLLGNPLWRMTSCNGETHDPQRGCHQIQAELSKINSLIYAQQNNFFQLHLGSKELQTEFESQKMMLLKLLGLYMHNTLQDTHFKKNVMVDYITQQWNYEKGRIIELGQAFRHQLTNIKQHNEVQLSLLEKQSLDLWLLRKPRRDEFLLKLGEILDNSQHDLKRSIQLTNATCRLKFSLAFEDVRRKLKEFQGIYKDFSDFSYVEDHILEEFKKSDSIFLEKVNETTEQSFLVSISRELELLYFNASLLTNQTLNTFKEKVSYQNQLQTVLRTLENVDTMNGHFVWGMNSSLLRNLPDGHGFHSRMFVAVVPRTPLEPARYAKLWLLRGSEEGSWKVSYDQDADAAVNVNVTILNQLTEKTLPCEESSRDLIEKNKVIVDFPIPVSIDVLVEEGYIPNEMIYIRCSVAPKQS